MASDIAQFLKEKFLESFQEKDLNLSPSITSLLNEIKNEFIGNEGYWSPPPNESLSCLYQLDYAVTECGVHKKTLSLFPRLDQENNPKTMLREIMDKLLQIRKGSQVNANSSSRFFISSMFPAINNSSYFNGFDEEIPKNILNCLESNDDHGFKAIGIHGMCGVGKTTLVKMVLNDPRVLNKYEKPIWVSLCDLTSTEEMDIKIVKEILACMNDDPDLLVEEPEDDWLVDKLCGKLKAQKKKYLIVLDGAWHYNDWFRALYVDDRGENMSRRLFSHALPKDTGGAVIVTSRIKKVAKQLVGENNYLIHLKPWSDKNMKDFLKHCMASQGKSHETIPDEKIDQCVYHCHGLPLVAVTLLDWIANLI